MREPNQGSHKGCPYGWWGSGEGQFASDVGKDGVAEGVVGVVAADALFVDVDLEDVFGVFGVVLEVGQAFD